MVTRVLLELCGPNQASSRTTDQELPDRVMRHPALTHCSLHTHKNPEAFIRMEVVRDLEGLRKRVTLACIPPEKELLKLLKSRETIFSRPTQSGLLRLSLGYTDDPLIQLLHDKWATYPWQTKKIHWCRGRLQRKLLEWINISAFLENNTFLFQEWKVLFLCRTFVFISHDVHI